MTPVNLRNAMNGDTIFGHAKTGVITNSATKPITNSCHDEVKWQAALKKAREDYSGHAVWPVAQTIYQNEMEIKNTASGPTMPQEQPENGGMMNMAVLNAGTSEGAHKGWESRRGHGDDAENGEERHSSGHDFNWIKTRGSGEKGEVWGTLLHKGKAIDGASGWWRTHDPKEAAQRALELHGKPEDKHTISDTSNVVGGFNVHHKDHGVVGFVKEHREDVVGGHYASTGQWAAHGTDGYGIAKFPDHLHSSKEDAAKAVSDHYEKQHDWSKTGKLEDQPVIGHIHGDGSVSNSAGKSVLTHGLEPILN